MFTNIAATPDTDTRYLHTQTNKIHDLSNHLVPLRGVNIGGWLVTEGWMYGQSDNSVRFALEKLEAPFGSA